YDEAWFGEHHSAGFEIIASPEVFIAAAAARTGHIRLGTGVSSLPYHHPFMLADRMVLLDHLTLGRAMFGVGPGALPSDAFMLGIDPIRQREMMDESLDTMLALFTSEEPITRETDWFTLRHARLQLRPYTRPHMEMAVAATVSPAGPRAAGKYGLGLLSIGATTARGWGADRRPVEPVGRLRDVPLHGARVGRPRGDAPLLRALRPPRHAGVPGDAPPARREPRLGGREPSHVHGPLVRGDRQGD